MPNIRFDDIQDQLYQLKESLNAFAVDNTAEDSEIAEIVEELDHLSASWHGLYDSRRMHL